MTICNNGQVILEEKYQHNRFTRTEIADYANWLGINLKQEPELYPLVYEGIEAPLPVGWKPCMNTNGDIYYFNFFTGQSIWDHPCDVYYKNKVLKLRKNRCIDLADRKQQLSENSLHKKKYGPCCGIKLLHIKTLSKPKSVLMQNNEIPKYNTHHSDYINYLNRHPVLQNTVVTENVSLLSKPKPPENNNLTKSTSNLYNLTYQMQVLPNKRTPKIYKTQATLPLVSQVDTNLLNVSNVSNSELLEDDPNTTHFCETTNTENNSAGSPEYKRPKEPESNICIATTKKHNSNSFKNYLQTKTSSDCIAELAKKIDKNHEEVIEASYKLCSMQKELVDWCNEIDKRLYDIGSQYKIAFCKDRIARGDNSLHIFYQSRDHSQRNDSNTSLHHKNMYNECPLYLYHSSIETNKKRPHSSDDYLLRNGKYAYTNTMTNATSKNSLVSESNYIETLIPVNSSQLQNLKRHLSIINLSKERYTIRDWNISPNDLTTIRKSYSRKLLDSTSLPQNLINKQLADYSRWLEEAKAYMKTLQSI